MHPFLQSVQETRVAPGEAVLWWMGQMGLLIKMGDTLLCVDYFASLREDRQVPPPVPMEEMEGIHAFLGTHDHLDHIDHEAWRVWAKTCPGAKFIFPRMHQAAILEDGILEQNCLGLSEGESCPVGEVTIRAIAAAHEFLDQDPATGLYPCLQYIIEGNGVRVYHAGDTLRYEGMLPKLKGMGKINAALLPINGRDAARYSRNCIWNMTFQEAADLAGELQPNLALPGHWDMFAGNSEDPKQFENYVKVKYGALVPVRIPQYMEPIRIG